MIHFDQQRRITVARGQALRIADRRLANTPGEGSFRYATYASKSNFRVAFIFALLFLVAAIVAVPLIILTLLLL